MCQDKLRTCTFLDQMNQRSALNMADMIEVCMGMVLAHIWEAYRYFYHPLTFPANP